MKAFLLLCPLALTAGCASTPPTASHREPYVKPGLILLTADQAQRRGIEILPAPKEQSAPAYPNGLDTSAVTVPPDIKVYTLSRAADPADPTLLHEEHVVYRRETTPRWRLSSPTDQKILIGPRVTDGREELKPLLDKELVTYLSDQRRATEANQQAITSLFKAMDALSRQQQAIMERELHQGNASSPTAASPEPTAAPPER